MPRFQCFRLSASLLAALSLSACNSQTASLPSVGQSSGQPSGVQTSASASASNAALTAQVLQLVNAARAQGGRCENQTFAPAAALSWNTRLAAAAQAHADDMAAHNYFSHDSLDGTTFDKRITAAGYLWRSVAENIAAGQPTPQEVMAAWIASPGHCRNIFNPDLREMGVGFAQGGTYGEYWGQDFGSPM